MRNVAAAHCVRAQEQDRTVMGHEQPALTIEKLHRDHGDRIRRYLARLVGTTEAEDLEQDVFERAQRALGTFRGDSRVLTWLYRVATNVAIDRLRTAQRRDDLERAGDDGDTLEAALSAGSARPPSPEADVDRAHMRECILGIVDRLPTS